MHEKIKFNFPEIPKFPKVGNVEMKNLKLKEILDKRYIKLLKIVEAFMPNPISIAELAKRMDLSNKTIYNYLSELKAIGYGIRLKRIDGMNYITAIEEPLKILNCYVDEKGEECYDINKEVFEAYVQLNPSILKEFNERIKENPKLLEIEKDLGISYYEIFVYENPNRLKNFCDWIFSIADYDIETKRFLLWLVYNPIFKGLGLSIEARRKLVHEAALRNEGIALDYKNL
jgi:DNA-binding Lrp family transcriptional regulator